MIARKVLRIWPTVRTVIHAFPVAPGHAMLLGNNARSRNRIPDRKIDARIGAKPRERFQAIAVVGHVRALYVRQPDLPESRPADKAQMHAIGLKRPNRRFEKAQLVIDVHLPVRRQADIPVGLLLPPPELIDGQSFWMGGNEVWDRNRN